MRIGNIDPSAGAGAAQMPAMQQGNDPVGKNIQDQIMRLQKQMKELSEKEMPPEEKMKKRQELQQEISNLQNQLRQHRIERRREEQQKKNSMDDMMGNGPQSKNASKEDNGISDESMQALISADSSMKQAKTQNTVKSDMEGRAGVLESEIKLDSARGGDTSKKKEELAKIEEKTRDIASSQAMTLSDATKKLDEAAKADKDDLKSGKSEDKDKSALDDSEDEEKKRHEQSENNSDALGNNVDVRL